MGYMTDNEYEARMKDIQLKNLHKERLQNLKNEKNKLKSKRKFKLPSTSKLILLGAVVLCLQIVIFCEYVMLTLQDTSAMYVLIGIPASLIPVILGYFYKSKAENTVGGIVYDSAMSQLNHDCTASDSSLDIESECAEG